MGNGRAGRRVSHIVDEYNRYPGEKVTFYTRVQFDTSMQGGAPSDLTLYVRVPQDLDLLSWQGPASANAECSAVPGAVPYIQADEGANYVTWTLADVAPGACYDYQVHAEVRPGEVDRAIESEALLCGAEGRVLGAETVTITVRAKGRYLRYLPELYEQDDLMGRFLMLFESFWKPIDGQINHVDSYLDPGLAPPAFLPWLASWVGQDLGASGPSNMAGMSEGQQRQLLGAAVSLARTRGTRQSLQTTLEIFSGGEVEIVEHRMGNMVLGPSARLGVGIAWGTDNQPHTLDITVRLGALPGGADARRHLEQMRRRLQALIEAEKPAHIGYTLTIQETGESSGNQ